MKRNFKQLLAGITLFTVLLGLTGLDHQYDDDHNEIRVPLPSKDQH